MLESNKFLNDIFNTVNYDSISMPNLKFYGSNQVLPTQFKIPMAIDVSEYLQTSSSEFGLIEHLSPVAEMSLTPARWDLPVVKLGTHVAQWD